MSAAVILRNNGQRVDTVFNLTVDEWLNGEWSDGMWVYHCRRHKCRKTYGAAAVPLPATVKSLVDAYMKYVRPVIIWREDPKEKMPVELLRQPQARLDWILSHPVEVQKEDCVFITGRNHPVGRYVK